MHDDDHKLLFTVRRENNNMKKILMGESMGGGVALLLHRKEPSYWDMAVLVAPMCKVSQTLPFFYKESLNSSPFTKIYVTLYNFAIWMYAFADC